MISRGAGAVLVLVRLGCGDAEEGLSRELSCVLAASHLPGWLLCDSGRQQPMGCTSIRAVGLAE